VLPLSENSLDEMVARERDRQSPPLTDWGSLSAALRAEGLMQSAPPTARFTSSRWMQIAAAVTLAFGGAAVGRMTAGVGPANSIEPVAVQSANDGSQSGVTPVSTTQDPAAGADQSASLASNTGPYKSPDEAWEALNRSGAEYQRASAYLSSTGNTQTMPAAPAQYRTRLAALDNVMQEMNRARKEAPQDPVIDQYYRATVGVREATLRQLGTTLPAGAQLNRY
jgi:hypothetical protein